MLFSAVVGVLVLAIAGLLHRWLALAVGFAFLAVPVAQVLTFDRSNFQTEVGTIMFVVYGAFGLAFFAAGLFYATIGGVAALLRARGWAARLLYGVVGVGVFVAAEVFVVRALFKDEVKAAAASRPAKPAAPLSVGEEALREMRSSLAQDLLARPELANRAIFDECMGLVAAGVGPRRIESCANGLVAAWDESHARKSRFANISDDARFAGPIGEMYVAHAEATGEAPAALAGVRGLQERVQSRYPRDEATMKRLRELESRLAGR